MRYKYKDSDLSMMKLDSTDFPKVPTSFKLAFVGVLAIQLVILSLVIWGLYELVMLIQRS